jgi:hypothetical protein
MIKNIVGLFVGQDSKKRQMGMIAGSIAIGLYMLGYIDNEQFNAVMIIISAWVGVAFSAKLTKIGNALKK